MKHLIKNGFLAIVLVGLSASASAASCKYFQDVGNVCVEWSAGDTFNYPNGIQYRMPRVTLNGASVPMTWKNSVWPAYPIEHNYLQSGIVASVNKTEKICGCYGWMCFVPTCHMGTVTYNYVLTTSSTKSVVYGVEGVSLTNGSQDLSYYSGDYSSGPPKPSTSGNIFFHNPPQY